MGRVAWPTVCLAAVAISVYLLVLTWVVAGQMSIWLALLLTALATYACYTVLHEACHGSISGSRRDLRWLNETLGYAAAWVLMIPMTAHRHEHLAHHRHANEPDHDPDYCVRDFGRSPWHAAAVAVHALRSQFDYYRSNRWGKAAGSQDRNLILELLAIVVLRVLLLAWGDWSSGLLVVIGGQLLGVSLTLYLFAYLVHRPHEQSGRWLDTSIIPMQGMSGTLLTLAWGYQNYHGIHHLFPRVPWYCYPALYRNIEPLLESKGAPIFHLGAGGLRPRQAMA